MFDQIYFFGRFNFPHVGYLYVIRETLTQLCPKNGITIVFSAEQTTWNKKAIGMTQRQEMFTLAIGNLSDDLRSQVHFSSIEERLTFGGYTLDTLRELEKNTKGTCGIVMGADAAIGIPGIHPGITAWKNWEEILSLARLIVVPRGRYPTADSVQTHLPTEILQYHPLILDTNPTPAELHSSSSAIESGETSYLPANVLQYTQHHRLLLQ